MTAKTLPDQRHVEAEQYQHSPPAENPVDDSFNIIVSVPESIQVRMVDASVLEDYEVWLFISAIISNAGIGFVVAYFQALDGPSPSAPYIGWTAVVFIVLFAFSITVALRKRLSLRRKSRDVKLKTTGASIMNRGGQQ
ncbi:MAG: hypothetical protein WD081_04075 [Gammaproteobacteria bacterium]